MRLQRTRTQRLADGMEQPAPALAEGLKLCGVYYEGFVTDLEGTLEKHRVDTISTFSIPKPHTTVAGQHHTNSEKENQVTS